MLWTPDELMGRTAALRTWSGGSGGFVPGTPPEPPPPTPTPTPGTVVGYGALAGVTGGGASPTVTVNANLGSAWSQLKAALEQTSARYIKIIGTNDIRAAGASVTVRHGDLTLDGYEWSGTLKGCGNLLVRDCGNIIVQGMGFAPGDHPSGEADWSPFKSNTVDGAIFMQCVFRWGADVAFALLNNTQDVTVQQSSFVGLYQSHLKASGNGYGPNVTTTGNTPGGTQNVYTKRITFYRNWITHCQARNMRAHGTDGIEWVNNAYSNYGTHIPWHMNPRLANIVGNMIRKGPESRGDNTIFESETNAGSSPTLWSQSVYRDDNIGIGFSPSWNFGSGVERGTPYGGGLHNVSADAASEALYDQVVTEAGRGFDDAVDTTLKAHALAGTSDGFYNCPGVGPAPHPIA